MFYALVSSCSNTAPAPEELASTCSLNGRVKQGSESTGVLLKRSLAALKAESHSGEHTNLRKVLSKSVKGVTTVAKFLQEFL